MDQPVMRRTAIRSMKASSVVPSLGKLRHYDARVGYPRQTSNWPAPLFVRVCGASLLLGRDAQHLPDCLLHPPHLAQVHFGPTLPLE